MTLISRKKVIFHEFYFETSSLEFEVFKSSIWKPTTLSDKGVFSFIITISQLRRPIELKVSQVCYFMHNCVEIHHGAINSMDTPSEKTSLWQLLPILVSSVFYRFTNYCKSLNPKQQTYYLSPDIQTFKKNLHLLTMCFLQFNCDLHTGRADDSRLCLLSSWTPTARAQKLAQRP